MKSVSNYLSILIYILLSSAILSVFIPSVIQVIEKNRISNIFLNVFEQFKLLDVTIQQVARSEIGTKKIFKLSIPEGRFTIKESTIKFEYESISFLDFLKSQEFFFENVGFYLGNFSFNCTIRENSCLEDEECIFSLYKLNNSHIASCNSTNYPYKVCCSGLEKGYCFEEKPLIQLLKEENSHAGFDKYNISICVAPTLSCSLKSNCSNNEVCIASFYKDLNSHAAICGYYSNNLCCYSVIKNIGTLILRYVTIKIESELYLSKGEYTLLIEKVDENTVKITLLS